MPREEALIIDVLQATELPLNTQGLLFLTDEMKRNIIEGLVEIRACIGMDAFSHFSRNDFEDTEAIIPLMREVVSIALEKGILS